MSRPRTHACSQRPKLLTLNGTQTSCASVTPKPSAPHGTAARSTGHLCWVAGPRSSFKCFEIDAVGAVVRREAQRPVPSARPQRPQWQRPQQPDPQGGGGRWQHPDTRSPHPRPAATTALPAS